MPNKSWPRYRVAELLDLDTDSVLYGIQTQREKGSRWMYCCTSSEAMLFGSKEEAQAAIKKAKPLRFSELQAIALEPIVHPLL